MCERKYDEIYKLTPLLYSSVIAYLNLNHEYIYIQIYIFFSIEFIYRRAGGTHRGHVHATENATLASMQVNIEARIARLVAWTCVL